jgi:hypothetical protein
MKEAASRRIEIHRRAGERLGLEEITIYPLRKALPGRVHLITVQPSRCVDSRVEHDQGGDNELLAAASLETGPKTHQVSVERLFAGHNPAVRSVEEGAIRLIEGFLAQCEHTSLRLPEQLRLCNLLPLLLRLRELAKQAIRAKKLIT